VAELPGADQPPRACPWLRDSGPCKAHHPHSAVEGCAGGTGSDYALRLRRTLAVSWPLKLWLWKWGLSSFDC
jgi:hypothetical protein